MIAPSTSQPRPRPLPSHREPRGTGRRPWRAALPWVLVLIAAWLPYIPALESGFTFDDGRLILENPTVAPSSPWTDSLVRPYWPPDHDSGLYRPLTSLTYHLQLALWGKDPVPFHVFNLLLHGGAALLALVLMRCLIPGRRGLAFSIALLFAVHPIHTEAVTNLVGRADLLAALFGLGAYLSWLTARGAWRSLAPPVLLGLAMFSKESAIAWVLVFALHRVGLLAAPAASTAGPASGSGSSPRRLGGDALLLGAVGVYVAARIAVLGALVGLQRVSIVDNPIYDVSWGTRVLTALTVLWRGIGLILAPYRLSPDYSFAAITPEESWLSAAGLLALLSVGVIVLAAALRRRMPFFFHAGVLYSALILPVSNLIVPIGTIMAERLLYLPSLGILAIVALLFDRAAAKAPGRALIPILLVVALVALGARSWTRNLEWRDDGSLFRAAVEAQPRSVKVRANLGTWLVRAGELTEAAAHYQAALDVLPDYPPALHGLGHVRILQQRYAEAEALLLKARDRLPESPEPALRLGNLYLEIDRPAEALAAFDQAARHPRQRTDAMIGRASALCLLGRYDQSAAAWHEAQRLAGPDRDLHRHLVAALEALIRHHLGRGDCEAARAVLLSEQIVGLDAEQQVALGDLVDQACGADPHSGQEF
ncbi:MAG: tetratricopeptide repeat protein [Candidatus Eisenbacteria sp.]|nr:tetratricopeptide repeat protein [Candidatus Eisenbacteria bacterium]